MQTILLNKIGLRTLLIIAIFLTGSTSILKAQKTDDLIEDIMFSDDDEFNKIFDLLSNYQFLYTSVNYYNKTYFAGRDLGIDQYNLTPQIFYLNSNGLMLGLSAVVYSGFTPKWNTTELTAGYSHSFGKLKNLMYKTSYSRYFFAKQDSVTPSFKNAVGLGISFRKKLFGMRLDGSLLFGNEKSAQMNYDAYLDIPVLKFGKYDKLSLKPELSLYFGTETTILLKTIGIRKRQVLYYGNAFGWMNSELSFPLILSYRNFDFEAGYNINFPRALGDNQPLKIVSTLNFSIGYIFGLN
ncbi:MAG: hypothetical protein NTY07_13515 [Bacteroidia bacterium]|nr:hypothetical protein [Bacteroidia bacterium]